MQLVPARVLDEHIDRPKAQPRAGAALDERTCDGRVPARLSPGPAAAGGARPIANLESATRQTGDARKKDEPAGALI